ncbi:MAG: hypothetical protein JJT94_10300, partial [Bernardetiaceae bacterium]|nr:hypothetical protein [Bernardetiaceae bacterium]
RIGRFLSIDPLAPDYPHNSPYAFSENRVIDGVELEGLEYIFYGVEFYKNKGYGIAQVGIKHSREIPSVIPGVNISQPLPRTHILTAYGGAWVFSTREDAWKAIHYIQEKHGGEWDSRNNPPGAVMTYGELLSFIDNFEGFFGGVASIVTGGRANNRRFSNKNQRIASKRPTKDVGSEEAFWREYNRLKSIYHKLDNYVEDNEAFRDELLDLEEFYVMGKQRIEEWMGNPGANIEEILDKDLRDVNNKLKDVSDQIIELDRRIERARERRDSVFDDMRELLN